MKNINSKITLLTFDIEEWFQVENLNGIIRKNEWERKKSTVVQNTQRILDVLGKYKIPATFFILGWVAERQPDLVKDIFEAGHEIACHGYGHQLAYDLSEEELIKDVSDAKKILEDIIAFPISGYRAPNFSINDNIMLQLKRLKFIYDSSYNPFQMHGRYGSLHGLGEKVARGCYLTKSGLYEIPIPAITRFNVTVPIGGGAYFRIYPYWISKMFISRKLKQDKIYTMYLHPWEFEPEQERVESIKLNYKIRHYYGLKKTARKLIRLIEDLKKMECQFLTMRQYVESFRD
jgi:polysaccharide deacetylase family protein (PEP-CTERM system associated)